MFCIQVALSTVIMYSEYCTMGYAYPCSSYTMGSTVDESRAEGKRAERSVEKRERRGE